MKIAHLRIADFRAHHSKELFAIFQEVVRLGYRTLIPDRFTPYRQENLRWLKTEAGRKFYSQHKIELALVFGNTRQNLGFQQFSLRGLTKVHSAIMILRSVHNLIKIIRYVALNPQISPSKA